MGKIIRRSCKKFLYSEIYFDLLKYALCEVRRRNWRWKMRQEIVLCQNFNKFLRINVIIVSLANFGHWTWRIRFKLQLRNYLAFDITVKVTYTMKYSIIFTKPEWSLTMIDEGLYVNVQVFLYLTILRNVQRLVSLTVAHNYNVIATLNFFFKIFINIRTTFIFISSNDCVKLRNRRIDTNNEKKKI